MSARALALAALQGVRSRPLRAAITVASLIVAALALMVASGGGALTRSLARDSFDRQNGLPGTAAASLVAAELTADGQRAILATAGRLAPPGSAVELSFTRETVNIATASGPLPARIVATRGTRLAVVSRVISRGRWLTDQDARATPPAVVANTAAAQALCAEPTARVPFHSATAPVLVRCVGVIDDGAGPTLYVHLGDGRTAPPEFLHEPGAVDAVLKVRTPSHSPAEAARVAHDAVALAGHTERDPSVVRSDGGPSVTRYVDRLQVVALIVALAMLGIAVLGVVNIGLATLRERTEELCLRRALGATRRDIFALVIAETLVLAAAAVLVAIAMSWLLYWLLFSGMVVTSGATRPAYPTRAVLLGAIIGVLAGVAAAAVPAARATRIPPASAMRA